ncbi:MAG: imidazole glycerol phosphate synthase subunit HisF [Bacillota bacterium]
MLAKRIIPCLDVKDGRVVKGVNFVNLRDEGDPVELAKYYDQKGADELVFLDITASSDKRDIVIDLVEKTAKEVFIPFTVGGGIRNIADMNAILEAGADKVAINSAAVKEPEIITKGAKKFGSQFVTVAVDAKKIDDKWKVFIHGGRKDTGLDLIKWIKEVEQRGAGEILLTSMDRDGTRKGYDLDMLDAVSNEINIPLIASGGAGKPVHLKEVLEKDLADAVLAASIFHEKDYSIKEVKEYLKKDGIPVSLH